MCHEYHAGNITDCQSSDGDMVNTSARNSFKYSCGYLDNNTHPLCLSHRALSLYREKNDLSISTPQK